MAHLHSSRDPIAAVRRTERILVSDLQARVRVAERLGDAARALRCLPLHAQADHKRTFAGHRRGIGKAKGCVPDPVPPSPTIPENSERGAIAVYGIPLSWEPIKLVSLMWLSPVVRSATVGLVSPWIAWLQVRTRRGRLSPPSLHFAKGVSRLVAGVRVMNLCRDQSFGPHQIPRIHPKQDGRLGRACTRMTRTTLSSRMAWSW